LFLSSRTGLKSTVTFSDDEDEVIASPDPTPEAVLIEQADRETVQQALRELTVPFREILLLCDVEEMSYEEIGQALAIPIGTVMSRLHRARKALRASLAGRLKGGSNAV
jgi:RNA polymerase sigma-70 factor, ECF subfamily